MNSEHQHGTSEIRGSNLIITIILNFLITIAEIIGGVLAGSLSLISDALHNLSDGLAIIISFWAIKISGKANDKKRTFGYKRASILAALLNSAVLIGISLFLFKEAYGKFLEQRAINGTIVIWVALIGLAANLLGVLLLKRGASHSLNLKAAYFHLLSDALSSVAVVLGGVAIFLFKAYWIDPVLTILISLYVLKESYDILRQTINVLMQGVPPHLEVEQIVSAITEIADIGWVHHVHLWNLDEKNVLFEAHLEIRDMMISEAELLGVQIEGILKERFGITHTTLQFECACCRENQVINKNCCREC